MRKGLRKGITAILLVILAVSLFMTANKLHQYQQGDAEYAQAEEIAALPDFSGVCRIEAPQPPESVTEETDDNATAAEPAAVDPYSDALNKMDFAALRQVNSEILGWILIPNTAVSYPILQTDNNSFYLKHTYSKNKSAVGAIFLEHTNMSDFSDFNTIIYGHNMKNGSMFAALKNYKAQRYFDKHSEIYVTDANGSYKYAIFAAYEVATNGETYRLQFSSDASKQRFLDTCIGMSVIRTDILPTADDKILTLSTCTGTGYATRWVVQAVLQKTGAK